MIRMLLSALILLAFSSSVEAWDKAEFCDLVINHTPSEDVNYVPGVDVHGNPVAPADLNAAAIDIPDAIIYPYTIDLAQWLGFYLPKGSKMETDVTMVEIFSTGKIVMDGKDISEDSISLCSKIALEEKEIPVITLEQNPAATDHSHDEHMHDETISGEGH